ncbi:TonB-dependent receptor [Pedobacter agri]|uniref:SusC/RagA family TonB-linked outer membrane protein n=1 Tax=Pedobacter agri TaxID=454586 RepID=UPI002931CB30|nr:TonB-dependent receptor [Pedobacter agri]
MRLTTVFIIASLIQVSAASFGQKITLNKQNVSLESLLKEIRKQSGYNFFFDGQVITPEMKGSIRVTNASIDLALNNLMATQTLSYEIKDKLVIITEKRTPAFPNKVLTIPDNVVVIGQVGDGKGTVLPGVTVRVKGNAVKPVITNSEGNFRITVPEKAILIFSCVGYVTQEVIARPNVYVVMQMSQNELNETVVVGYGTTKKKDLTGSVSSITSEDIQQIKSQTIDNSLVGKLPGVNVQSRGGAPGSGALVNIRGLSQIRGDNQPLYVIDGTPVITTPNSESLGLINYGSRENPLLAINPDDVERIDVLKDASAAAIYGSRAANGVILVTTKRGKRKQEPKFSFNTSTTIQNPVAKYDFLSANEYRKFSTEQAQAALNKYPKMYWPYFPQEYAIVTNPEAYFGMANTDWQDLITKKNALWTQYGINVNGGSENVNYMMSAGISNQKGVMAENDFKRYTFSSNLDASITESFKIGGSVNYNYSINRNEGFNSLNQGSFRPDLEPYNQDGSYTTTIGPYGKQFTLLGDARQLRKKAISKNLIGSIYGEVVVLKDLRFRSQLNIGLNSDQSALFNTSKSQNALFQGLYYSRPGASLREQQNEGLSTAFENTLSYIKLIGENHKIDAVAGISWNRTKYDAREQQYRGFPDDDILTDVASANFFDNADSESLEQGLNSMFGRVNYAYKGKYLLTFTARRDGSTKFGPDNRYGFFPSGAVAWNIHHESFMKNLRMVNQLKLRASIGRTGSDNLPSFTYLSYYKSLENNDSFYDGQNGIVVTGVPNTKIRWEQTDQLDLGLDFSLFNYRVTGELAYYKKNTSGIILLTPIASETGSSTWNTNVADVSNRGWEFIIGVDVIRNENFKWNSSFNISTIRNNVDNLYGGTSIGQDLIQGQPLGVIIGYDVVKIAQTQSEIDALNSSAGGVYQNTLTKPGDYIFRDINNDGKVNNLDRGAIGDINPKYFGGWNNSISYKNWDMSFNWNFSQGGKRQYDKISNMYNIDAISNPTNEVFDTWKPDRTDASYAAYGSATHGFLPTSRSVVKASYIKLRSASIGYSFSAGFLKKIGINKTRLSLSGNNLLTITNYPGLDPEDVISTSFANRSSGFNRDNGNSYPNVRTLTFSLNVSF